VVGSTFEIVTPYTEAELPSVKYAQSADTMTLTHPNHPPYLLKRTGASTFTLAAMVIGAVIASPTGLVAAISEAHTQAPMRGYTVTAISASNKEESLPAIPIFIVGGNTNGDLTSQCGVRVTWTGPAQSADHYNIYATGVIGRPIPPQTAIT